VGVGEEFGSCVIRMNDGNTGALGVGDAQDERMAKSKKYKIICFRYFVLLFAKCLLRCFEEIIDIRFESIDAQCLNSLFWYVRSGCERNHLSSRFCRAPVKDNPGERQRKHHRRCVYAGPP